MPEAAVVTANNTPYRVWITIYDLGKTLHLDYGWLEPASHGEPHGALQSVSQNTSQVASVAGNRIWRGGYYYGDRYHVRGEVIDDAGQVIADAVTQVNLNPGGIDSNAGRMVDPALVLMADDGQFWWQVSDGVHGCSDRAVSIFRRSGWC